ncbi:MAG: histidine kinase [Ignavibacteriales bacterium CG18_big_fil_WC_8_21_14_2_50_31_20]|nr:MAG: histidine kinase [Ignavibacteriales bacterium CG18_big_fil_WC_8_21_14_2_50_31_20]
MVLFILAVLLFAISDLIIRTVISKMKAKKIREERANILNESLNIDLSSTEAKSLKRVEIENPKAKILCVDDEAIILDSFRKILVLDGYSVDTVENGREALQLLKTHHYDFLFTDLKMPIMDGVEVTKATKELRPDIDVVIITGFASVETAVETMKYGAIDYIQKPFTEDELLDFTKKAYIKREARIRKELKPKVHISHLHSTNDYNSGEFAIPGGVFISKNHCWVNIEADGNVKAGIDDFAKKIIGNIDDIEMPNLGMKANKGSVLFSIRQKNRTLSFISPVSGVVTKINTKLKEDIDSINITPYETNWICSIDADNLDNELQDLKIGKAAVAFYHKEIDRYTEKITELRSNDKAIDKGKPLFVGELSELDEYNWNNIVKEFILSEN